MNAESTREALDVASLAGDILLASGAEIFRVEETIDRIARAYGVDSSDAFVLSSGIFLTAESGKKQEFARVRHIPLSAARLDKVTAVNQLSREIEEGLHTPKEAKAWLLDIQRMPEKPKMHQVLASGVGSACFCFLFGGDVVDSMVAFLSGFVLYFYLLYLLLTGRVREITPKRVLLLLAVAAAVILPWAVLRWQRDGFTFLKAMFQTDVAQRAGLTAEELGTDFYWYLYIEYLFQQPMFAGAMILCAVSGPLLAGNGRLRREEKADLTGLLLWLIVPVLFFSLIPFKLRWYVYASLTAGAALLGWTVQQLANRFGGKSWKALACLGVSVALITVCSLDCLSYVRNLNYRQNYQQMMINALHRETDAGVHAYVQYGETADGVHVTRWQDGDRFIAELYGALVCEDGGAAAFEADEGRAVLLIGAGGQEALTERLSGLYGPALEKGGVMLFTKETALP